MKSIAVNVRECSDLLFKYKKCFQIRNNYNDVPYRYPQHYSQEKVQNFDIRVIQSALELFLYLYMVPVKNYHFL